MNPFTAAKYDYVMAGKAEFTPEERSVTTCSGAKGKRRNEGHRDGGPGEEPLFTDFTASNLGLPPNPSLFIRRTPDQFGSAANSDGLKFLDMGVGGWVRRIPIEVISRREQNVYPPERR